MSIMKKPAVNVTLVSSSKAADNFIDAAPDGPGVIGKRKEFNGRVYKQKKVPVTFTAERDLLDSFDQKAADLGLSRAALLALAMSRVVKDL